MVGSMPSQPDAVLVGQRQNRRVLYPKRFDGLLTDVRRSDHAPLIIESDQPGIKGSIPQRRQQQAIVNVETFLIAVAFGPRDDVGGA